ncbi:MAG: hypothetical protein M9955_15745 [Rhizobiaceae bacterium]|nr:hypothetical protein [Rhizobiaceae bacterium]
MARISAIFHTPLPQLLAMRWDEGLLWWPLARDVHAETFGLMARVER